jgi:tripartite-type tricarboxylate transporter receptor subunit TctC
MFLKSKSTASLKGIVFIFSFFFLMGSCFSQSYPKKSIVVIESVIAGGAPDVRMRQVAPKLSEFLGQAVVVDNRPGANGAIAAREAAKAFPDGYVLLHANISNLLNDVFGGEKGTRVSEDFIPIGDIEYGPLIMVVNPNVNAKTLKELIELAKAKPNILTYGSGGAGGLIQLLGERVKLAANIQILEVPYKSPGAEVPDLLAGHLDVGFGVWANMGQLIKNGKLRALAVASNTRLPTLPEVPTMSEGGLNSMETTAWNGLFAPLGTPVEVIQLLSKAIAYAENNKEVKELFNTSGSFSGNKNPEQFAEFIKQEKEKWSQVVKSAGIKIQP